MHPNDDQTLDCPHRVSCGACSFLLRPYGEQLERKRRRLADVLRETIRLDRRQVLPTVASPKIAGYRNRAKMTISSDRDRRSSLGYFRRSSREVVDAPDCAVLVPELLETTRELRRLLNASRKFPFNLRHIDLRCGSDPTKQHLTLVIKGEAVPPLPVEDVVGACPHVVGIAVNLNPRGGPQVIKGRIEHVHGAREVFVESAGLSLRVSPGSFFQVNLDLLPEIHDRMGEFFGPGDLLVDLFAGVGTHGLALRRLFRRVVCVEGVRSSVADARSTIKAGRVTNVDVVADPIHRARRRLDALKADAIILNPSAAGADPAAIATVTKSTARSVAYLSCDPKTLGRDLRMLVDAGFKLATVQPIDMMPQTRQIEALALLRR